ncbi:acyloxyacyl hydrolase [Bacteroidota bacterium]
MRLRSSAIFIFFIIIIKASAQTTDFEHDYTFTTGGNLFIGSVYKHDKKMGHLSHGLTRGFEICLNKNTYGGKTWEQVFGYPDVGMSLGYFDYGTDILGQSLGLFIYSDFYLIRRRKLETVFKFGTGLGFHNKPYDNDDNHKNVSVSSHITGNMQLRLGLKYKLTDRWKLTGAITLSHFSQAAYSLPNKGVNVLSTNLGATYFVSNGIPSYQPLDENYQYDKSLKYNINFSYGVKEITPIGGPKYSVYVLTFYIQKQVSKINILNLGLDGFANTALKEEMRKSGEFSNDYPDHKRIGIMAGHELKLDRVALLFQVGAYLYRPYKTDAPIYQRVALKYYAGKRIYFHYGFITHYAKADHSEWGIGLSF